MREILKAFKSDYLRIVIAVTNTILAISMFLSPETHNFFFWFTLVFRLATIPTAIFIGNKGLWILYFIFCNVKAFDITYNNYTCVALITVLFSLTPKVTKHQAIAFIFLYITDVFIIAGIYNKTPFYIYTQFLLVAQFAAVIWKQKLVRKNDDSKMLVLTPDEMEILSQLENDQLIKQVKGFSEPTVYRKLADARQRNGLSDNQELIKLYKERM